MKKVLNVLLFFIMFIIIPITVLAENNNSNEVIVGTYQYSAIEGGNKQNNNTFIYKDSDFTKSSFKGSKSLETLSIQVASASLSWYGKELDQYEIDYTQNDYNIKNFLNEMRFNNIESNKYYNLEKKENSVGVIIGYKTIVQDGKSYTLLAIVPRSAGYKQEWVGNFTIGDKDIHEGFKAARDEILRFTKKYIEKNNIKGNLKVWTVGYSRGAAISNMVGGFFAGGGIEYFGNKVTITPEDVYCYTIGTPSSVKNGASKNVELSVSANRTGVDYINDTEGEEYNYTKGGTVSVNDSIYNGIRNIISFDDAFSLLPPEQWEFTRYGRVIDSYEGLNSIDEMLEELKNISEYVYEAYTSDGKIKEFIEKKFDLKTLSIIDKESNTSKIDFFKGRLNGLVSKIGTNKIYNDEYQVALKSIIGTYGMMASLTGNIETSSMETSEMIYPLLYTYLAYASDELQNEGKASSEEEAVAIALEDLLTYFTETEIDKETFTIDDFVGTVLKYLADNEGKPVSDAAISGIINLVPEEYRMFLSMLKAFSKPDVIIGEGLTEDEKENELMKQGLKDFIRACYYGPDPESDAYIYYGSAEETRKLLYMTMVMTMSSKIPEINNLLQDSEGNLSGEASFEEFVSLMLDMMKEEKYSTIGELADEKLSDLLDNLLLDAIEYSEELYGSEYKNDLQKHFNNMKENITEVRKIISALFFYTEGGYNIGKSIENTITLIENASVIAMPHFDEIYLSLSRNSYRYDDIYECIKGDGQEFDYSSDDSLTFVFNFDYNEFKENGKILIDNKEVPRSNYTIKEGSTIITLNKGYLNKLSKGDHLLVASINNNDAVAQFAVSNINNPNTLDNILLYVSFMLVSLIGLFMIPNILRKEK